MIRYKLILIKCHNQFALDRTSGVARNLREGCVLRSVLDLVLRFLDPTISNCRWPSVSLPAVSSFGDCTHVYRSCDLPKTSVIWKTENKYCAGLWHFWSPCIAWL